MIIKMAALNLRFKRFRSAITILGVVIGIGSIYLLVSFGVGLQHVVQEQVINNESINTIDITSADSKIITLTPDSIKRIKSVPKVEDAAGVYMFASQATLEGSSLDLVAYGVNDLYLKLSDLTIQTGRLLDPQKDDELIINGSLLEAIGVESVSSMIGKTLELTVNMPEAKTITRKFHIVGVINSQNGSEVFISSKVFENVHLNMYAQAKAIAEDQSSIANIRHSIESMGYQTTSPVDTLDQIGDVFRLFNIILIGLGSIGLVIAILGMANTLTVSLLERTKEIGLIVELGARAKDVRRLFTAEAMLLSLTGGIVGMTLATLLGWGVDLVLNTFARNRGITERFSLFSPSILLIVATLTLVVVIGFLVSYIPARRAARINPIDALRRE